MSNYTYCGFHDDNSCGCANKTNVISKTYDLKYRILQSLHTNIDTLFFYIKDRNFRQFKDIYEKYKFDKEAQDENGNTMLNLAVQSNSFKIVNFLLNNNASVNTSNYKHNTPLHYALAHHNFEIADLLIKKGANENVKNNQGLTPWQCLDIDCTEQ